MGQTLSPSPALMRRHHAAMTAIKSCRSESERIQLLFFVVVGSPEIDAACEEMEEIEAAERELVGAR